MEKVSKIFLSGIDDTVIDLLNIYKIHLVWKDGWMGCMDGWVVWMDGWLGRSEDGRMDSWVDGRLDVWLAGWVYGW